MAAQDLFEEAKALVFKGDIQNAIPALMDVLNGKFYHSEALMMLGCCFLDRGKHGLAAVLSSAAIDARESEGKGAFPEAMRNLAVCYKTEHQNDVAERILLDALRAETIPRERAQILTQISGLYFNEGQPETMLRYCDEALSIDPDCLGAKVNRGQACLELGRWQEGWKGYRAMALTGDRPRRVYGKNLPEWDGAPGKRVIVYGDQGVGDEIYYANCMRDLIRVSEKVIFDCHPRLVKLFERSFPEVEVHGTRKNVLGGMEWVDQSGAECSIALPELSLFFRRENQDWDGRGYLLAHLNPPDMPAAMTKIGGPLRIGLSWTGGTKRTRTDLRSLDLEMLEPILRARPDADWYSLQYTADAARQVCELEERTGVRISHYPGWVECFDYDRTASFVASLDLVITVCTTAHHLGGALGVPTWTLVPSRPGWRYQLSGSTIPWYNSVVLYRQHEDGDWSDVVAEVAEEVAGL